MTPRTRSWLLGGVVVLVVAGGVVALLRSVSKPRGSVESDDLPTVTGPGPKSTTPTPTTAEPGMAGATPSPEVVATAPGGSSIVPGLRKPFGEDLSDPKLIQSRLREALAADPVAWTRVAALLSGLAEPVEPEARRALLEAMARGNDAGALQAFGRLRDPSLVPDLLRMLDDLSSDPRRRSQVLVALSTMPAADKTATVEGISSRLSGTFATDMPALQAIARVGGPAAVKALVDAVGKSSEPARFGAEIWRSIDLRGNPESSRVLVAALTAPSASGDAMGSLVDLAGRPGASPELVTVLIGMRTSPDEAVRRKATSALAATGDEKAVEALLKSATEGDPQGAEAGQALAATTSLSLPARARVMEVVKSTPSDPLRQQLVEALGNAKVATAVPMLSEYVVQGSDGVRREAVIALGRIGPAASESVEVLRAAYPGGDEGMRTQMAATLAEIGTDSAKSLLEQLEAGEASPLVKRAIEAARRRLVERRSS